MSTNDTTTTADAQDEREPVLTGYRYKQTDTCNLYETGHRIAARFDDVLSAFEDEFGDRTVTVVAGGCNGCTYAPDDADVWASYVAQTSGLETLFLGCGAAGDADLDDTDVAERLCELAEEHGVEAGWDGNSHHTVCLGDGERYEGE